MTDLERLLKKKIDAQVKIAFIQKDKIPLSEEKKKVKASNLYQREDKKK